MKTPLILVVLVWLSVKAVAFPDLLVSVNEFTGSTDAERYVGLYSNGIFSGVYLAPHNETYSSSHAVRDLVQAPDGTVWVFNGTFSPTLWEINPAGTHTLWTIPEWSIINQTMRGGIAMSGKYLFLTDNNTASQSETELVIRVDVTDMSYERFALDPDAFYAPFDLEVHDGLVYTMESNGNVWVHDVETLALLRTFRLPQGEYFGIAVGGQGYIYTSGYDFTSNNPGKVKKFTLNGLLVDELLISVAGNLGDIDVNDLTGEIAVGTSNVGQVLIMNEGLDSYSSFTATTSSVGGGTFVAFPVVPEPSILGFLGVGGLLVCKRYRKR